MYRDFVGTDPVIQELSAHELLTWDRLDLAIKIYYLSNLGRDMGLPLDIYREHIKCFSLGSYTEPGNPQKNSLEKYVESFVQTHISISTQGFDDNQSLLPLSIDGALLNGAHRLSCAIIESTNVKTIKTTLPRENYDWKFFKSRGLQSKYLDIAASTFVDICPDIYIAILWPRSQQFHNTITDNIPHKVYVKDLKLTHKGIHNFLSICYKNEPWLGQRAKDYPGIASKLSEVYQPHGQLRIIAFQAKSAKDVMDLKTTNRAMLKLGKHSLHVTDNHVESQELARLVFNDNGVHFLNHAKPNKFGTLPEKINSIKLAASNAGVALNDLLVDSSLAMEIYGLRQAGDIDILCNSPTELLWTSSKISNHISEITYHNKSLHELIYNPENYFYYEGVKFLSLKQLRNFKESRGEEKDRMDARLIDSVFTSEFPWRDRLLPILYFHKAKIIAAMRKLIVLILKKVNLYDVCKKIFRTQA